MRQGPHIRALKHKLSVKGVSFLNLKVCVRMSLFVTILKFWASGLRFWVPMYLSLLGDCYLWASWFLVIYYCPYLWFSTNVQNVRVWTYILSAYMYVSRATVTVELCLYGASFWFEIILCKSMLALVLQSKNRMKWTIFSFS